MSYLNSLNTPHCVNIKQEYLEELSEEIPQKVSVMSSKLL